MKKIIVLLSLISLVFLTSCGKKDDVKPATTPQNTSVDTMEQSTPPSNGNVIVPPSPPQVEIAKPVAPAEVKVEPVTEAPKVEIPKEQPTVAVPPTPPVVSPVKPVEVKKEDVKTIIPKQEVVPLNDTPKTTPQK